MRSLGVGLFLQPIVLVKLPKCSKAIKTVAIFPAVKLSIIVQFKNTGIWLLIQKVSGVYRMCILHSNCTFK